MLKNDLLKGAKAAASYIGITPMAVYHMTQAQELPFVRLGGRLYFRRSELDRAFSASAANDQGGAQ